MVIGPKTNLAFLRALAAQPGIRGRNGRHRLHRRQSRAARGRSRIRRTRERVHAAARLLIERRDEGRASPLHPFDPWRVADSFELVGSRRIGVDVAVDGVPVRACISSKAPMWIRSPKETARRRRDHAP